MVSLTVALFGLLGVVLCIMMLKQGLSRRIDLFSIRNFYLAGLIVYMIVGPAVALSTGQFYGFRIFDPEDAGKQMLLWVYAYTGVFLLAYHRSGVAGWLASKFSARPVHVEDSTLTGLALALIVAAVVIRMVGIQIPLIRGLSINTANAVAAASCAIIAWVWGRRKANPVVLLAVAIILSASFAVTITFSRRPLVGMLAAFLWGAYHRWAKHLSPGRLIIATTPFVLAIIVVVAAFTAVRTNLTDELRTQETLSKMASSADIRSGTSNLFSGQASSAAALWLLDRFDTEFEPRHLFSLRYMAYWLIPRTLWEDKPNPLSGDIAQMARIRGVRWELITMPPTVIGYAKAEGGFYALMIYAVFFGQFVRFFDELVRRNPMNPYVIVPVGCVIGQFLGLARGDIAVFTNLSIVGAAAGFAMIYLGVLAAGGSRPRASAMPLPQMR